MERLLAEQPAKPLNEAHQPSRSRVQLHHATASRQQQQQHQKAQDLLLSFPVCGDFANQRISLASGLVLAAELGRTLVLPQLLPGGGADAVPFGEVFDAAEFAAAAQAAGILVVGEPPSLPPEPVELSRLYNVMAALKEQHATTLHLRVSCPAYRVPAELMVKHEQLVFAALAALRPVAPLQEAVHSAQQQLQQAGRAGKAYTVVHLKAEDAWIAQCATWAATGVDNCLNNTDTVGEQLALHNVDKQNPVLLTATWLDSNKGLLELAVSSLEAQGYKVFTRPDAGGSRLAPAMDALVDYYLALDAHQTVVNSASTFGALLIMERWQAGRYATYYNGGNIPLEAHIPLYRMPWVFTYNDWSSGTEYDEMVKVAVSSAIKAGRLKPYCMFGGSADSSMYRWLQSRDVTLIQHEPVWKEALIQEGRRFREEFTIKYSQLYGSDGALVGAFQRMDIPILPQLDQYNYVLFTDCDVFFRRPVRLVDFGTPLPSALGLGYENFDEWPYNDGVMLWNLPYMRRTNQAFVNWTLSQRNGLWFEGYGPVDQGAFLQYYEHEIKGKPINKVFNYKIYHAFRPTARIVHMHGPKINHYVEYFRTGKCGRFEGLCEQAYEWGSICEFAAEYVQWAREWRAATVLHRLCGNLWAGVWHFPWQKTCDCETPAS
ncbi:hypothetical protein COHA_005197 [Chlorella ohadii]|uniref:O-fucosyltransferase family protein n=1 Tax=Chlorella ohadii TaxID=2649997 RepID=A0AAD5DR89_9CHLO|nr:hypothetical protein COHA_005197 [Chlorella ohadii]